MKKIIILLFVVALATNTQAQLLKKLKEKVENKIENKAKREKNKAENKVDNSIDNTLDNAVDTIKKAVTVGNAKTEKSTNSTTTPTETTKDEKPKPTTTSKPATSSNPAKKMTSEEKELAQLYAPTPYRKFTGEVPKPKGAYWPNAQYSFFDADESGYGYFVNEGETVGKGVNAMSSVHYYKVDKNLNATHYLSFEVGEYEEGDNSKYNLLGRGLIKKDGNIFSFGGQRNGVLLYKITPDGVRITLAGSSFNYKKMKDGKGVDAWIGSSSMIKEMPDGSILFQDGGYEVVHENFPDIKETAGMWRMVTPDGEIKTITDANGKPIQKRFFSNIIADKNGYWYFSNDYEILKFKPGIVIDSFISVAKSIYKNDEGSEYELRKTEGKKKWVMGKLGVASFPGIAKIAWGPDGEIYFYSEAADRFAVIKNGVVSHFCGNSDFSNWYGGYSLGAKCEGNKDGSATTAQICGVISMKWIGDNLVVLRPGELPDPKSPGYIIRSFMFTKIDKSGTAKSLAVAQNINQQ